MKADVPNVYPRTYSSHLSANVQSSLTEANIHHVVHSVPKLQFRFQMDETVHACVRACAVCVCVCVLCQICSLVERKLQFKTV